jgi:tubulin polyglutamylase TTLL4
VTAPDIKHLNKYQKTNHFPGSTQLGRKDLLWRNINRMRLKFPKEFNISPMSYLLSEDYEAFQADRERDTQGNQFYILKPVAASCGRGIKLCDSKQRVSKKEGVLASKYVENPHLINGLKYDLRVYVLVTQYNPLKVYIYNDGLVRFATEKYTMDPKLMNQKFVHLTNFSINKKNTKFVKNNDSAKKKHENDSSDQEDGAEESSKWDFKMLQQAFEKMGASYNLMYN